MAELAEEWAEEAEGWADWEERVEAEVAAAVPVWAVGWGWAVVEGQAAEARGAEAAEARGAEAAELADEG